MGAFPLLFSTKKPELSCFRMNMQVHWNWAGYLDRARDVDNILFGKWQTITQQFKSWIQNSYDIINYTMNDWDKEIWLLKIVNHAEKNLEKICLWYAWNGTSSYER